MELGKRIKMYRTEKKLSQDTLAEKVYVSRQTISNWENDKSYPDVHSLVLLSKVLDVSLDQLIKGDIKMMKEQISSEDRVKFKNLSILFTVMIFVTIITPIPLAHFLSTAGIVIWVVLFGVTFYLAALAEREKKKFDMKTYREIVAFMEGTKLDEIEKAREEGKRPYQKIFYAVGAAAITLLVSIILMQFMSI